VKNVLLTAVTGLTMTLVAAPIAAQSQPQKDAGPDAAHVRELIQQAQQQLQPVVEPAPRAPFVTPGPRVDLSLQDASQRATERNLDIAVARINPRLDDFSISALEAVYRPNLTSQLANRQQRSATNNQTQGSTTGTLDTGTASWQGGFAQNLQWHGAQYSLGWVNSRTDSSNLFSTRNPTYNSSLTASYTQPLLRGFKIDPTRAALQTTKLTQDSDEIGLQATVALTVASAKNAYWDLVYAIQAVDVAQQSLDLASKLVQDNRARVEIGTLAPIDVVSAQAEEATRKQTLVQAEAQVRTSELALKRLIVSGTDDPLWTSSINPTDRPASAAEPINLEAAVGRALRERTDLAQAKKTLAINDVNLRNLVELTRPALDFNASYGLAGIGGTQFIRGGELGGTITNTIPSGYFDALSSLGRFNLPTWTVQLNLAVPLGYSAASANLARAKLQTEQTQANLKALELTVATDVTSAAITVQSDLESVQAAAAARELAQKKLEAAQSKFEVGMSTNYEVVQAQRDLQDAQNTELRTILDYRKALVTFEQVQTVSASRGNVTAVTSGGGGATTGSGASSSANANNANNAARSGGGGF
jgi:outer membrane protein TolC